MRFPVCSLAELKHSRSVTRWIEDLRDEVVLLWLDEAPVAFSSVCPHFAGPLQPDFANRTLHCPWHGWRFDIDGGRCLTHTLKRDLRRYEVVELDGQLEIFVDDSSPPNADESTS